MKFKKKIILRVDILYVQTSIFKRQIFSQNCKLWSFVLK